MPAKQSGGAARVSECAANTTEQRRNRTVPSAGMLLTLHRTALVWVGGAPCSAAAGLLWCISVGMTPRFCSRWAACACGGRAMLAVWPTAFNVWPCSLRTQSWLQTRLDGVARARCWQAARLVESECDAIDLNLGCQSWTPNASLVPPLPVAPLPCASHWHWQCRDATRQ